MRHFQCALSEILILPGIYQREPANFVAKFLYFQELEIKGKKYQKLHWLGYSILSKYKDGREQLSDLDVTNLNNYPTMVFAPVNSYTTETFQPLNWRDKVKKKENLFIDTSHRYKLWEYNNKRENLQSALVCQRHGDFKIKSEFCYACTFKMQTILGIQAKLQ